MLREKFWSKRLFVTRKAVQKSIGPAREVHRDHGSKKQETKTLTERVVSTFFFLFLKTHLGSVRQKERRRQVSSDAAENVNDGDPHPASELLQVSQYCHLEHRRHETVQQAAGTCKQQQQKKESKIMLSVQPSLRTPTSTSPPGPTGL